MPHPPFRCPSFPYEKYICWYGLNYLFYIAISDKKHTHIENDLMYLYYFECIVVFTLRFFFSFLLSPDFIYVCVIFCIFENFIKRYIKKEICRGTASKTRTGFRWNAIFCQKSLWIHPLHVKGMEHLFHQVQQGKHRNCPNICCAFREGLLHTFSRVHCLKSLYLYCVLYLESCCCWPSELQ